MGWMPGVQFLTGAMMGFFFSLLLCPDWLWGLPNGYWAFFPWS